MNGTRICNFCGKEKVLADFPFRSKISLDHREVCFECSRIIAKIQLASRRSGKVAPSRTELRRRFIFGDILPKAAQYGQPFRYPAFDDFLSDLDKCDDELDKWCGENNLPKFGRVPRKHVPVYVRPEAIRED